jgi:hypothetical protein
MPDQNVKKSFFKANLTSPYLPLTTPQSVLSFPNTSGAITGLRVLDAIGKNYIGTVH